MTLLPANPVPQAYKNRVHCPRALALARNFVSTPQPSGRHLYSAGAHSWSSTTSNLTHKVVHGFLPKSVDQELHMCQSLLSPAPQHQPPPTGAMVAMRPNSCQLLLHANSLRRTEHEPRLLRLDSTAYHLPRCLQRKNT